MEELPEGFRHGLGQGCFFQGVVHQPDPSVARIPIDGKGEVTHPQARVAALLDIARRAAESEDQKIAQALFGAGEIFGGIHRSQDGIIGDLPVKGADEALEALFANKVIDTDSLVHECSRRWR